VKVYLNGKLVESSKAVVSVFDHGLLYGDGVFEGIRCYDRLVFKLKEHVDRLFDSATAIELKIPLSKNELIEAVVKTLKANKLTDAYIRLVITRGAGDLGLDPRKCKMPTVFIIADKITLYPRKYYHEGLEIITAETRRNLTEAVNPKIKSLNYLNNILAKIEAVKYGVEEALMLTHDEYVAECTGDNIFAVRHEELFTPPAGNSILEGVTRDAVITLAKRMELPFAEKLLTMEELYTSSEVFLTGTAAEIIPVVKIDKKQISSGKPGPITIRLMEEFKKLTKFDGVRY
jgi:branched-chain amino acid aminotransferase